MAHTFASHSTPSATTGFITRFTEIFAQAKTDFANWRMYNATLAELHSLGARELDDLGLNQADIKNIALEAVYGKNA